MQEQRIDPDSTLSLYRRAIAARNHLLADDPPLTMLDFGPGVLAYERGDVTVVSNMSARPVPMPFGEVALSSAAETLGDELPPDTSVWLT